MARNTRLYFYDYFLFSVFMYKLKSKLSRT